MGDKVIEPFMQCLHDSIAHLVDLDPKLDTPCGRLLTELTFALSQYMDDIEELGND